jgi:hypothetical protein
MSFGMANAPAMVQNMVDEILRGLIGQGVVTYIDDILIHSIGMKGHHQLVLGVLARLEKWVLALSTNADLIKRQLSSWGMSSLSVALPYRTIRLN